MWGVHTNNHRTWSRKDPTQQSSNLPFPVRVQITSPHRSPFPSPEGPALRPGFPVRDVPHRGRGVQSVVVKSGDEEVSVEYYFLGYLARYVVWELVSSHNPFSSAWCVCVPVGGDSTDLSPSGTRFTGNHTHIVSNNTLFQVYISFHFIFHSIHSICGYRSNHCNCFQL